MSDTTKTETAQEVPTPPSGGQSTQTPAESAGFKSDETKQAVLADLAAVRAEKKRLESQINQIAASVGVDAKKGDVSNLTAAIERLSVQLDVSELARQYGIQDADDVAALMSITDPDTRAKLAARLAPSPRKGPMLPDPSQGAKGEQPPPDVKPGLDRLRYGIEQRIKSTTN